jgi:hypothetical protein
MDIPLDLCTPHLGLNRARPRTAVEIFQAQISVAWVLLSSGNIKMTLHIVRVGRQLDSGYH